MENGTIFVLSPYDVRGWVTCCIADKGDVAIFKNSLVAWSLVDHSRICRRQKTQVDSCSNGIWTVDVDLRDSSMQSRQGLSRLQLWDNAGGAKNVNTATRPVTLVWCSWYALVLCLKYALKNTVLKWETILHWYKFSLSNTFKNRQLSLKGGDDRDSNVILVYILHIIALLQAMKYSHNLQYTVIEVVAFVWSSTPFQAVHV